MRRAAATPSGRGRRMSRTRLTPGTSALFVMTSDAVVDKVTDAFKGANGHLIQSNLSQEQEDKLREVFEED